jgi:two-component system sensor histidine kinase BaeS
LTLEVDLQAPDVQIMADAQRLQQVLHNILENSARYTDQGGVVRISSRVSRDRWDCVIEDSAPSVPTELLSRLGERFFRVDASRQRATGGSGLGLAVSRQLVIAQAGELQFAASALGGIAVKISLPIVT